MHVVRQIQILGPMGTCPVQNHDDEVLRMSPTYLLQKFRHVLGVHFFGNHPVELAVVRTDRPIHIGELSFVAIGHDRTAGSGSPTPPGFCHAPKTSFVLEDQTHGTILGVVFPDGGTQCLFEFFFQAAWTA